MSNAHACLAVALCPLHHVRSAPPRAAPPPAAAAVAALSRQAVLPLLCSTYHCHVPAALRQRRRLAALQAPALLQCCRCHRLPEGRHLKLHSTCGLSTAAVLHVQCSMLTYLHVPFDTTHVHEEAHGAPIKAADVSRLVRRSSRSLLPKPRASAG